MHFHEFSLFDWSAFAAFWIGAIVLGLDASIKSSVNIKTRFAKVLDAKLWSFLPLICFTIVTAVLLINSFGVTGSGSGSNSSKWPQNYKGIEIRNKTFTNQEVVLDGYDYEYCKFYNVSLVYNGKTPIQFSNDEVNGFWLKTNDNGLSTMLIFLKAVHLLPDNLKMTNSDGVPLNND